MNGQLVGCQMIIRILEAAVPSAVKSGAEACLFFGYFVFLQLKLLMSD